MSDEQAQAHAKENEADTSVCDLDSTVVVEKDHGIEMDEQAKAETSALQKADSLIDRVVEIDQTLVLQIWPYLYSNKSAPTDEQLRSHVFLTDFSVDLSNKLTLIENKISAHLTKFPDCREKGPSQSFEPSQQTMEALMLIEEEKFNLDEWKNTQKCNPWVIGTLKLWFVLQNTF